MMRSFVEVGEAGSFSRAAKHLGISGSLVSRHISELEKYLDVRLVNRTARAVSLTPAGERHFEFARHMIQDLDAEDSALQGLRERDTGPLAVICPKWIGNLDLGEAIADFAVDHPNIHVKFEVGGMSDRAFDFLDRGYDVAFHTRELRDSSMLLRKLTDLHFVLCASPGYLAGRVVKDDPSELSEHDLLAHIYDPVWHLTGPGGETSVKIAAPVYSSNSYLTLRKAVVRGRGVALLPLRTIADDLEAGRLVRLCERYEGPVRSLYAVHSPGMHTLKKVRIFLDYMAGWFTANPQGGL
jgi:DNA-binding transcriptional LysR family regulator